PEQFKRFRAELEDRHVRFRSAVGRLFDAAEAHLWRDAIHAAEEVLAVAPEHREAKAIRGKAWLAATSFEASPRSDEGLSRPPEAGNAGTIPYPELPFASPLPPSQTSTLPRRFLLWVDGVGGYLVCLSNRVTFGQATAEGPVDVPLFADVSRLHAEVS